MGVNGILPRILPSAGRENYDLRALSDGIISITRSTVDLSPKNESEEQDQTSCDGANNCTSKRRRTLHPSSSSSSPISNLSNERNHSTKVTWIRRKVRVAVDVNGWISRAVHGHGGHLIDERQLSYHGRAELKNELRQQQKRNSTKNNDKNPEQREQLQQQRIEYVAKCISFVLQRIEYLQIECGAEILPVLDGNTPPCKKNAVGMRFKRRKAAVEERDGKDGLIDEKAIGDNTPGQGNVQFDQTKTPGEPEKGSGPEKEIEEAEDVATTEAHALRQISLSKRAGFGTDYSMKEEISNQLLKELQRRKWPFIVAPYEADGQLAFLANIGAVDLVVTEDSDLIALGVQRLVYRLGGWNGKNAANRNNRKSNSSGFRNSGSLFGTMLQREDLGSSSGISLFDFSDAMLAVMYVAAGCDYCESLQGIGIVTARNIVHSAFHGTFAMKSSGATATTSGWIRRHPVLKSVLEQLYQSCHKSAREKVLPLNDPDKDEARSTYEQSFLSALAMFRHPLVYDPMRRKHIISNDVSDGRDGSVYVSPSFSKDEKILMEYKPYRDLVSRRFLLYKVVGQPLDSKLAVEAAEGKINMRNCLMNKSIVDAEEEGIENENAQSSTSQQQLPSQDYSGSGTQQSKSSSAMTFSLSPDLLASPSPLKNVTSQ